MEEREYSQEIIDRFTPDELERVTSLMKEQLEIKDRKYHFKAYNSCFLGRDMVNWLLENSYGENIEEALDIGNFLMSKDIFHHVCRDHPLKNQKLYYIFESDEKDRGHLPEERKDTWQDILQENEGKLHSADEVNDILASLSDWPEKNPEMQELLLDKYNREVLDNCRPLNWVDPEGDTKYDMIAIGGGAGGLVSSIGAAISGGRAAIIERNIMGGDCLNTGCVPSKAFIKAAKVAQTVRNAHKYGVMIEGEMKIDFGKVMERMRKVRAEISEHDSVYKFAKKYGIDIFLGDAKFVNKGEIEVNGKSLQFAKCCIATGGHPFLPEIEGLSDFPYLTSENIFNITEQPKHLVIIGVGPIGCELGQSFARFGTKVTMISRGNQFLPKEDPDAASYLHQSMMDDGIEILFNAEPVKIHVVKSVGKVWSSEARFEMDVDINGVSETIQGDSILIAAGRRPNVHGVGLEEGGVEYDDIKGIKVNDYCKTTNKNVYAVGDVCSPYQFTHNSDHMARNVVRNALFFGKEKTSDLIMSWSTFTDPEIAHVGKYPYEMDKEGVKYETYKYDIAHNDRAIWDGEIGIIKIHCKKGSDKILGATIVGGPAGDMICQVSQAMFNKIGLSTMGTVVHPYPTYAEAFKALTGQYNLKKLTPKSKTALRTILNIKR